MASLRIIRMTVILLSGCQFGQIPPPVTGPPVCNAQHSWENYHLPHWALEHPVVIHNTSSYKPDLDPWNTLAGNPIQLVDDGDVVYVEVGGFVIEVKDGGDANSGWLGLASVWADAQGHISKGVVTMNLTLLAEYGPNVAAHVLAQEIGHILGLGHQHGADDSAMDDCQGRGTGWLACLSSVAAMTPNAHDGEQLATKYQHAIGDPLPPSCAGSEFQIVLHTFSAADVGDPGRQATPTPSRAALLLALPGFSHTPGWRFGPGAYRGAESPLRDVRQ